MARAEPDDSDTVPGILEGGVKAVLNRAASAAERVATITAGRRALGNQAQDFRGN